MSGVLEDLTKRDLRDSARAGSPLTMASGAFAVDSSARTVDAVAEEIADKFRKILQQQTKGKETKRAL